MEQFSTSETKKQMVKNEKPNGLSLNNLYHFILPSFNRNLLKRTGIFISQFGVMIVMLSVFNSMAAQSTEQLHQAHMLVENEYLYANAFQLGLTILMFGFLVFLMGVQKINLLIIKKEELMGLKKFSDLNFKKVFGSWRIADLFQ